MAEEKSEKKPAKKKSDGPVAKKDWILVQNEHKFQIKKGEPLPDGIPDHLLVPLRTEGVID